MGLNLGSGALDAPDVRLGSVTPPAVYHGSSLVWPLTEATWDGDFESIATITVGAGGASSIEFVDIPQTFAHLQIRMIGRDNRAAYFNNNVLQFNGDTTAANWANHFLYGEGNSASAFGSGDAAFNRFHNHSASALANSFSAIIMDILDYSSTSKNTTVRVLQGRDNNGTGSGGDNQGFVMLSSGLWKNTSAVSSIKIAPQNSASFVQHSTAALYGVRG